MSAYKYKSLMEDFINEVITVDDFEREYLITFKNETERMGNTLFEILNGVFEAVDCYWYECLPGQETAFEISEQQLRKEVNEALVKLNSLLKNLKIFSTNGVLMLKMGWLWLTGSLLRCKHCKSHQIFCH
ncbi:colicin immunity domain-containing protein [Neobacillus drentensis]|uniref:colicin immunity domain-containing protein n=1 Tax=Neobacillus drentensis TaxID=220684 RepID=UPI00300197A8